MASLSEKKGTFSPFLWNVSRKSCITGSRKGVLEILPGGRRKVESSMGQCIVRKRVWQWRHWEREGKREKKKTVCLMEDFPSLLIWLGCSFSSQAEKLAWLFLSLSLAAANHNNRSRQQTKKTLIELESNEDAWTWMIGAYSTLYTFESKRDYRTVNIPYLSGCWWEELYEDSVVAYLNII